MSSRDLLPMLTKETLNPEIKQFLALSNLAINLRQKQNIDDLINSCNNELAALLNSTAVFFAVVTEDELIVQNFLGSDLNEIAYDKKIFDTLAQGSVAENNNFIFLPITIKDKLCGCLAFKQSNQAINPELLLNFAKDLSITISEKRILIDLQQHNENLLKQNKQKIDLLCTISHELRTPMANILGYSELLSLRDFDKDQTKVYQQEIHNAAIKLAALIDNFLNLSRIESAGDLAFLNLEEIEIDWLAEQAWQGLKNESKNHELVFYLDDNLPMVEVDADAITRVFANLFSNAIKYSPTSNKGEQKKIICEIRLEQKKILVSIIDEGLGIPADSIETIFERFYRIEEHAKKNIGGTGLGLWICKRIIEAHNGRIWCSSTKNKGSTFSFTLPLKDTNNEN